MIDFHCRLNYDLHKKLKLASVEYGVTMQDIVNQTVEYGLNKFIEDQKKLKKEKG